MRTEMRPRTPQPQRQAHEVIAEASCRLAAARDRGEVYAAACDAALALLGPDPAAAAVLMTVSESGLTAIKTRGAFAGYETLTIAADALPERTRTALADGQAVSVAGGLAAVGLRAPGSARSEGLLLLPVVRRGRRRFVLAVAASESAAVEKLREPINVLVGTVGLALDADQGVWAEAVIEGSQDIVLVLEPDSTIRTVNAAVERILGFVPGALAGTPIIDLIHPDDAESLLIWLARAADKGHLPALDIRCQFVEGGWVDVQATATAMLDVADVRGIVVNLRDIRERKTLEAELSHWAFFDPLTNLANRAGVRERLTGALDRAARTGSRPAVLLVDLDDFKAVNDALGHSEGDRLLVIVAERLRHCIRTGDTVGRLGGDEFVVLVDDEAMADRLADRILAALDSPVMLNGAEVRCHASIGVRVADTPASDVDHLLRDADLAMYAAKAAGKATWKRFHPDMHEQVQNELTLRADLRRAVERKEFVMYYQPIVRVETQQIVGFEALIRWQHPERGLVSPDNFIPHAERTGLIVPIGAWVMHEACAAAMVMREQFGHELVMSVNVSPRQLESDDIVDVVRAALQETGLPASALCVEITESVLADDITLVDRLRTLRGLGTHMAIDDFGTGFSSYSHLQHLPIDTIKIDRSFVDRLGTTGSTPTLASSIIRMSQGLGLRTVAEGVESTGQLAELQALGCLFAQGYLFSRPVDIAAAIAMLADANAQPPVKRTA
jgi:diguanylate cyclase (GGDEF)-like protein/PAS domain S-box-containing protein